MIRMRWLFEKMFPFSGLAVLLALTLALAPAMADSVGEDDVLAKAAEAVEAGVLADFVYAAIEQARTAGLDNGDVEEMLEDLKEAVEDGNGQDLNAIVDDHIAGYEPDGDVDDDDDGDVDDDDDGDVDDDDDGDDDSDDNDDGDDD